jgi:predicted phosphoribosyltransferase
MRFRDRSDAARRLLPLLNVYRRHKGVVLGIPRGGISIAVEIADSLHWSVTPLLVKKLTHPDNSEYAIGAVSLHGTYIDPLHAGIMQAYIDHEVQRQRAVLQRRSRLYHIQPCSLDQKVAMIVDDGIATGNTMRYAVEVVRLEHPRGIVIVSPVASMEAVRLLRPMVEDLIVLHTPHNLGAIGEWYDEFSEVTDAEVVRLLSVGLHHENQSMGRALRHR